jgi:hypothetical protein
MVSFDTKIFVYATPSAPLAKRHTGLPISSRSRGRPLAQRELCNNQATMLTFAEPWLDHADARRPALFVPFQGTSPGPATLKEALSGRRYRAQSNHALGQFWQNEAKKCNVFKADKTQPLAAGAQPSDRNIV